MKADAKPWWFWALLAFTILLLVPIWYFHYLPLNDWPNHLAGVHMVLENDAGRPSYLQANPNLLLPNSTGFWFMRVLGPFVGVETSGRLLLCITIILSIWGAAYFMRQIHPDIEPLGGALGAALAYNWFFLMGFLNYALSIPLFLIAAGYWMKPAKDRDGKAFAGAVLLSLLATLTHIVAGAVLVAVIGVMRLIEAGQAAWNDSGAKSGLGRPSKSGLGHLFKNIRWDLAFALPVLAIALLSLGPILAPEQGGRMVWGSPWQELNYLLHIPPNPALSIIFLVIVATDILLWMRSEKNGWMPAARWLAVAILLAAGAMLLPESTASWQFAAPRLWPFFIFALAAAVFRPMAERGAKQLITELAIAMLIFTAVEMGVMMVGWVAEQPRLEAIASVADYLQPAAAGQLSGPRIAVLPIGEGFAMTGEQGTVSPYFHAWGYWVVQKGVYAPYVFAEQYSPVQFKDGRAHGRTELNAAIGDLAYKVFARPTAEKCRHWKEYYQAINWTRISEEYDYVVLRVGACENASIVPAPFEQKLTNGPLYIFENRNRKK